VAINRRRIVCDLNYFVCCSKSTNILRTRGEKLTVQTMNVARAMRSLNVLIGKKKSLHVRFWHKADMSVAMTNVRFWKISGH
jgi:hypothetical protein